ALQGLGQRRGQRIDRGRRGIVPVYPGQNRRSAPAPLSGAADWPREIRVFDDTLRPSHRPPDQVGDVVQGDRLRVCGYHVWLTPHPGYLGILTVGRLSGSGKPIFADFDRFAQKRTGTDVLSAHLSPSYTPAVRLAPTGRAL